MWFVYVPLVALILVAVGSAFVGFLPGVLGGIVLAIALGVLAVMNRARTMQLDTTSSPGGVASTQAAYEPQTDPTTTPQGGSTAT